MGSRTSMGMKNSQVALLYYVLNMFLGFVSRRVLLDYLGADILGLNTTANNILGFLNLAELGIGSAIAFSLYKPISDNNTKQIIEIVTVQGWLYRKIAFFVCFGSCILMIFLPSFFKNITFPSWYIYSSFLIYLYSSILTYLYNYKQIVLSASQEEYRITYGYKFIFIGQTICQIFAVKYLPNPYVWWLVIHALFASIATWNLNRIINKRFPYLKVEFNDASFLVKKYPTIIEKVKQLFVHKIAAFVLIQASPLVIYAYTSLTLVAIYGNYMLIVNNVMFLFQALFNGVTASVGNLVAEGNKKKILSVFEELFVSRFLFVSIVCICLYYLVNPFMQLWLGRDYLFEQVTVILLLGILYIQLTRSTIDAFISAYGLFKDIYAPIVEGFLNLSLSITFGAKWGINGVLCGVLISLVFVVFLWKPFFVFKYALQVNIFIYIKLYLKCLISFFLTFFSIFFLEKSISLEDNGYYEFLVHSMFVFFVSSVLSFLFLYLITDGMKLFFKRMFNFYLKK